MKSRILTLIFIFSFNPLNAFEFGKSKEDAGQAGTFLSYAASARSLGMGRAYTGVADDAAASYWNASGLAQLTRKDVVTLYSSLQEGADFGFFSYAQPSLDYGTFGVSFVNLRSGGYERREAISGNAIGSYEISESAFLFSHGIRTSGKLSVGSTLKVIRQEVDTQSAMGYGIDLGAMYPLHSKIKLGLAMSNLLAPQLKLQSEEEQYPRELRAGLQFLPSSKWMVSTDFVKSENSALKLNLGTEFSLSSLVALRAGLTDTEITAGLGFALGDWNLDYALGQYLKADGAAEKLGSSHRFGLHFKFGTDVMETNLSVRWQNKGQALLAELRKQMNSGSTEMSPQLSQLMLDTLEVIQHRGYPKAQDLYEVQGYLSFFRKEYVRSVQSFAEAVSLDGKNELLAKNLERARALMTETETAQAVDKEMDNMKHAFEAGNLRAAVTSAKKILNLKPDHIEASAYLTDAQTRLDEPVKRALKIARAKFERQEYLDAVRSLHEVRQLDPENMEAADLMSRAIDALERASGGSDRQVTEISRDSQKSREFYSKGLRYYSQGKIQEALVAWKDAVRYDSGNTSAQKAYERAALEAEAKQ